MTANQSTQLVKNPNTKKAVAALRKYAKLEMQLKAAEKEAKEATETIKQAMIDANVPKIEFDPELTGITGYITLASRTNYKVTDPDELDDQFKKLAPDTEKIKAQHTLTGELPAGVVTTETQYITKKIELAE
ncbi:MAG TPA: hypothetical protein VD907_07080 [Verrucomicrobiae bacterium]|nr:hypothetical protein [Verrucomicrobiae bacterium]